MYGRLSTKNYWKAVRGPKLRASSGYPWGTPLIRAGRLLFLQADDSPGVDHVAACAGTRDPAQVHGLTVREQYEARMLESRDPGSRHQCRLMTPGSRVVLARRLNLSGQRRVFFVPARCGPGFKSTRSRQPFRGASRPGPPAGFLLPSPENPGPARCPLRTCSPSRARRGSAASSGWRSPCGASG